MSFSEIISIAGSTSIILGALLTALWVWFSHKSRGPLGNLERKLREAMHTEVGRIETRSVERHELLCAKLDKLDLALEKQEEKLDLVKTIALRADGKADMALRDLDKGDAG